jgi:hypothetical protein
MEVMELFFEGNLPIWGLISGVDTILNLHHRLTGAPIKIIAIRDHIQKHKCNVANPHAK